MIDETWYVRPAGVPERWSAGGVVARREGERVMVALVREKRGPDFVIPKGGIERGESPEVAARREVAEEAGIASLKLLGELGSRERLSFNKRRWVRVYYFLYLTEEMGGMPTDWKHHREPASWFGIEELPRMAWPEQREVIETNRQRILEMVAKE